MLVAVLAAALAPALAGIGDDDDTHAMVTVATRAPRTATIRLFLIDIMSPHRGLPVWFQGGSAPQSKETVAVECRTNVSTEKQERERYDFEHHRDECACPPFSGTGRTRTDRAARLSRCSASISRPEWDNRALTRGHVPSLWACSGSRDTSGADALAAGLLSTTPQGHLLPMPNLHHLHRNGRRRLESRRRTSPWIVVLVVATAMYSASIGLTIAVAFTLESRVATIEAFLGSGQE